MKCRSIVAAVAVPFLAALFLAAQDIPQLLNGTPLPFYIYHGPDYPENHYTPSGWMGDYKDLSFTDKARDASAAHSVIRIAYAAKAEQQNGWAGIYWQNPANNWGDKPGGLNLNGARELVFRARGAQGGEKLAEVKVGGIGGAFSDSAEASLGSIVLTKNWKEYVLPLSDKELSSIAGGFCLTMSRGDNPQGAVVYLDDIRFN